MNWLLLILIAFWLFALGFGMSFVLHGRRLLREQGMRVPGWVIVCMMFVGPERAARWLAHLHMRQRK